MTDTAGLNIFDMEEIDKSVVGVCAAFVPSQHGNGGGGAWSRCGVCHKERLWHWLRQFAHVYNPTVQEPQETCILNCDSPSYPPEDDEYKQCGCRRCQDRLSTMTLARVRAIERQIRSVAEIGAENNTPYPSVHWATMRHWADELSAALEGAATKGQP